MKFPVRSVDHHTRAPAAIMVVEDEYFIRVMIADELRSSGFEVVECSSADEAVDVLHAGFEISIVFTDIRMPGSLDGIALAEIVGRDFPALLVVLTSAQPPPNGFAENQFVSKPYDPERVVRLIDFLLTGTSRAPRS